MRTTVGVLLVLNLVAAAVWLGGFGLSGDAQRQPPVPDAPASLRLLSELAQPPRRLAGALPEGGDGGEGQAQPATPVAGALPPGSVPDSPQTSAPAGASAPADGVASVSPDAGSGVAMPADRTAAAAPTLPAVAATPAAADGMAMPDAAGLATGMGPRSETRPAPQSTGSADAPATSGTPVCYRTAALSGDVYQAAAASLRAAGFEALELQPQNGAQPRYWVYWSGDLDQVGAVEARLKAAAVRDWYRMRMPGREARLALGVYGKKAGARIRQRALAEKGVPAQIDERYPPQAMLRWRVQATPAQVAAAAAALAEEGVPLEPCP